ncbi:glyceraldehyde-3-phosphate dehydrogenase [Terribacillus sp. 179-K 1B1 HS]|uniref:glyceraldehyde-3-phosphate dehydrogenase n=1 Tax=Terribacillus sp. 179-K 1B1 HS TaxID=3142388 RepID=UPI0039A0B6CF
MTTRIAINGFGRIGRLVCRQAMEMPDLEIVAVNASYPAETLTHLLRYDSVHGNLKSAISAEADAIVYEGKKIRVVGERDPKQLPWEELGVDVVIEATGKFCSQEAASAHLDAGAKKVVITAPGKNVDATIVIGVNDRIYESELHNIVSNASCTTNCLAPVVKVLDERFTIKNGLMTTVHSFTNDQKNIDNPHKDLRRARGCTQSIIPTTTGAAKALAEVLPHLKGKLHGMALRVPTPNVSLVDLVVDVEETVTAEQVNDAFRAAAETDMRGIISYSEEPLVSIDYTTTPQSATIDGLSTIVMEGKKIKVIAWYDNEWGYSCRVVDLAQLVGSGLVKAERAEVI